MNKGKKGDRKESERKKETIIDLSQYVKNKTKVAVKLIGGREIRGILRGFDATCNLVMEDTMEFLRGK